MAYLHTNTRVIWVLAICPIFSLERLYVDQCDSFLWPADPPGIAVLSVSASDVIVTGSEATIPAPTTNTSLSLHCLVETTGTTYYQWLRGGVEIESGYQRDKITVAISDPGNGTGSYQCIVSTTAGTAASQAVWILKGKLNV